MKKPHAQEVAKIQQGSRKTPAGGGLRRIAPLSVSYGLFLIVVTSMDTVAPAIVSHLGGGEAESTYTFVLYTFGAALTAAGSARLFSLAGRKKGFIIGALLQLAGAVAMMVGLFGRVPEVILLANGLVGMGMGMGNFLRFAATEVTALELRARSVSYVMLTGICAAVAGPLSGEVLAKLKGIRPFLGSAAAVLLFSLCNLGVLLATDFTPFVEGEEKDKEEDLRDNGDNDNDGGDGGGSSPDGEDDKKYPERPFCAVITSTTAVIAISLSTLTNIVMVLPMASLYVVMVREQGMTLQSYGTTLLLHILATFSVGPVTAKGLAAHGTVSVGIWGATFAAIALPLLQVAQGTLWVYIVGMVFLGMSWNCGYSAGSVLLVAASYHDEHVLAKKLQAFHDMFLLVTTGCLALISGQLTQRLGFRACLLFTASFLLVQVGVLLAAYYRRKLLKPRVRDYELHATLSRLTMGCGYNMDAESVRRTMLMTADTNADLAKKVELGQMGTSANSSAEERGANPLHGK